MTLTLNRLKVNAHPLLQAFITAAYPTELDCLAGLERLRDIDFNDFFYEPCDEAISLSSFLVLLGKSMQLQFLIDNQLTHWTDESFMQAWRFATMAGHDSMLIRLVEMQQQRVITDDFMLKLIEVLLDCHDSPLLARLFQLDIFHQCLKTHAAELLNQAIAKCNASMTKLILQSEMLSPLDNELFEYLSKQLWYTAQNGEHLMLEALLAQPELFNVAEKDIYQLDYQHGIKRIVEAERATWPKELDTALTLTEAKAKRYVLILRHLIRQIPADLNTIGWLLAQESIQAVLVEPCYGEKDNALFKFVLSLPLYHPGRQSVLQQLLAIESVQRHYVEHHHYRNLARLDDGLFNDETAELVNDDESSMRALTIREDTLLNTLLSQYENNLQIAGGQAAVIATLKQAIKAAFIAEAPSINMAGKSMTLPFEFADIFQLIDDEKVSGEDLERLYRAYYQHPLHGAFRYLSIPNPFINTQAEHICHDEQDKSQAHANFKPVEKIIALLYLAASDENAKPQLGGTVADRVHLFFQALSLMNRAHNWDNLERDNQEKDYPTCIQGTLKRLYQALHDHPTINPLNHSTIEQELIQFARKHFKVALETKDLSQIQKAYQDYCDSLDEKALAILKQLNISQQQINEFLAYLEKKYTPQFDSRFKKLVNNTLKLETANESHFGNLYQRCGLAQLTNPKACQNENQHHRFFHHQTQSTPSTPQGQNAGPPPPL